MGNVCMCRFQIDSSQSLQDQLYVCVSWWLLCECALEVSGYTVIQTKSKKLLIQLSNIFRGIIYILQ